ncbi:MAG: PH domain-containing protein [Gemmataceae bacterium]|nr:PH domain-containing protein [Gemmataceae bacterium]
MLADADEPEQEVDVWWGGYSPWAMLPNFVVCGVLTIAACLGVYAWADDWGLSDDMARYLLYAVASLLVGSQVLHCGYRTTVLTYRLTTHRLFCGLGLLRAAAPPIAVADIRSVRVQQTALERRLGVGRLRIHTGKKDMVLFGVWDTERIAALIERLVETRTRASDVR